MKNKLAAKKLLSTLVVFSIVPSLLVAGGLFAVDKPLLLTDENFSAGELQRIMDRVTAKGQPHPKNTHTRILRFSRILEPLAAPWQELAVPTRVRISVEKHHAGPLTGVMTKSIRLSLKQGKGRATKTLRATVLPEYIFYVPRGETSLFTPPTLRQATISRVAVNRALAVALPQSVLPLNLKTFFRPVLQTALRAALATARRA